MQPAATSPQCCCTAPCCLTTCLVHLNLAHNSPGAHPRTPEVTVSRPRCLAERPCPPGHGAEELQLVSVPIPSPRPPADWSGRDTGSAICHRPRAPDPATPAAQLQPRNPLRPDASAPNSAGETGCALTARRLSPALCALYYAPRDQRLKTATRISDRIATGRKRHCSAIINVHAL